MTSLCEFDGQEYTTEEYGASHPFASILKCGCSLLLHPDGNGGYATGEEFGGKCPRGTHDDQDEAVVRVEKQDKLVVLVRRDEGDGWQTKPKPTDLQFALLMEQRKTNTLLRQMIAHTHDNTELLLKIHSVFVPDKHPGQDAQRYEELGEWAKTQGYEFDGTKWKKAMEAAREYSDFELSMKDAVKHALKEIAEEATDGR